MIVATFLKRANSFDFAKKFVWAPFSATLKKIAKILLDLAVIKTIMSTIAKPRGPKFHPKRKK